MKLNWKEAQKAMTYRSTASNRSLLDELRCGMKDGVYNYFAPLRAVAALFSKDAPAL